jgi:hypothetical protein
VQAAVDLAVDEEAPAAPQGEGHPPAHERGLGGMPLVGTVQVGLDERDPGVGGYGVGQERTHP